MSCRNNFSLNFIFLTSLIPVLAGGNLGEQTVGVGTVNCELP